MRIIILNEIDWFGIFLSATFVYRNYIEYNDSSGRIWNILLQSSLALNKIDLILFTWGNRKSPTRCNLIFFSKVDLHARE